MRPSVMRKGNPSLKPSGSGTAFLLRRSPGDPVRHKETVIRDHSEPGHAAKVDLGSILEGDYNVPPLADQSRHDLHVLDCRVREVASILTGEAGDDGDTPIGKAVAEEEGSGGGGDGEREPEEGESKQEVGNEVSIVSTSIEEDPLLLIVGCLRCGGFRGDEGFHGWDLE